MVIIVIDDLAHFPVLLAISYVLKVLKVHLKAQTTMHLAGFIANPVKVGKKPP